MGGVGGSEEAAEVLDGLCFFPMGVMGITQPTGHRLHKARGWTLLLPPPHPVEIQNIKVVAAGTPDILPAHPVAQAPPRSLKDWKVSSPSARC